MNLKNKMVMKKEEKIKDIWINIIGNENYKSVLKNHEFKENGWRSVSGLSIYAEEIYDILKYKSNLFSIRPKSLKGIENNNGWVKIESEYDLPKIGQYDMSAFELFYFADERVVKARYCTGLVLEITHYRLEPLIKPQPPIY